MKTGRRLQTADLQVYEPAQGRAARAASRTSPTCWRRREFAAELSRATLRASHTITFFGRLWLVSTRCCWRWSTTCSSTSSRAAAGVRLPRPPGGGPVLLLLHLRLPDRRRGLGHRRRQADLDDGVPPAADAAVGGAQRVLPLPADDGRLPGHPPRLRGSVLTRRCCWRSSSWLAWSSAPGVAAFFAALQVYFRDTASFLPYFVRIWLYLSPVLWYADEARQHYGETGARFAAINPLYTIIGGWSDLLVRGNVPPLSMWLFAAAWAVARRRRRLPLLHLPGA